MTRRALLAELQRYETELHRADVRRDRARLEALLHPEFIEFGRSGRRYERDEIINELKRSDTDPKIHADDFELRSLAADCAMLTYLSAHVDESGNLFRRTLRTSIWAQGEDGWQMLFHQGTPAD